jgi:hypothetical protein
MAKNKLNPLEKFTSEQLRSELARRENENGKWGFVVIDDSDAEEDDQPLFGIVTVEDWERDHALSDCSLGRSVSLPKDFWESQESQYAYSGKGGVEGGKRMLIDAGFKYLGILDI